MTRKKPKPLDPTSTEKLFAAGVKRGIEDWRAGRHTDPYLDDASFTEEDRRVLSHGWGAGQDSQFREAAEQFDYLMRRDARN